MDEKIYELQNLVKELRDKFEAKQEGLYTKAEFEEFAEKDLCDTWEITDYAINAVLEYDGENPPKKALIPIILETYLYDS